MKTKEKSKNYHVKSKEWKHLYLRKVQVRNKKTKHTKEVRSSSDQVGGSRAIGIIGTNMEPKTHPRTRATNLELKRMKHKYLEEYL